MAKPQLITCIADLISIISSIENELPGDLWWRGQDNSSWELKPGVFRGNRGFSYETTVITRFRQRAGSRYAACPLGMNGLIGFF